MKYLQSFLIPRLIDESNRSDKLALLHAPPLSKEDKSSPLAANTYHSHWLEILRWELDAVALEKEQIVLWKVVPKVAVWKESEFVLFVPGIRENHPHLEVGDLVHLREVMEAEKRGTNRALEGRVVALRKREGLVREFQGYLCLPIATEKWNRHLEFASQGALTSFRPAYP